MRRWINVFLLFFLLICASTVRAQSTPIINLLRIEIWPEFDRPDVLIIYHLTLTEETTLPARLTLRIPMEAGKPFNVAMQDVDGLLYTLEYSTSTDGDWIRITFITPSPDVQLEYYDPDLKIIEKQRIYDYVWPGDYPVNSLSVRIQQPISATNMMITPDMGGGAPSKDGLTYYNALLGAKKSDEPLSISFTYQKPDNILSSSLEPVQSVEAVGPLVIESRPFANFLPWVFAGMGVLLIAGGATWYWRTGRASKKQSPKLHPSKNSQPGEEAHPSSNPQEVYCFQCGKRATPGDLFCRSCGARLRK